MEGVQSPSTKPSITALVFSRYYVQNPPDSSSSCCTAMWLWTYTQYNWKYLTLKMQRILRMCLLDSTSNADRLRRGNVKSIVIAVARPPQSMQIGGVCAKSSLTTANVCSKKSLQWLTKCVCHQ